MLWVKAVRRKLKLSAIACAPSVVLKTNWMRAAAHLVDDVGPALAHLVDDGDRQPRFAELAAGAARRDQLEAPFRQLPAGLDQRRLVLIAHRDEDRARERQVGAGAELRLGEGAAEIAVEPHDLAGRFHLGAEDQIDAGEAGEREHRLLDRDMRRLPARRLPLDEQSASFSPAITRAAILAIGTPVALATNGTVREARGLTSST